jgi:hypothetical protein
MNYNVRDQKYPISIALSREKEQANRYIWNIFWYFSPTNLANKTYVWNNVKYSNMGKG